jgi:carboxyl-terminal processing protease
MASLSKLLPPLALVGALAMVPIATTAFAAAETDTQKELETFFSVFERVRSNYVDKVDDHTLIKGAIDGMLSALDPHSSYAEASDFTQLRTTTEGNYGGLGLTVSTEDGAVKVIAPTEDTPADRAGIKAGDIIVEFDGKPVKDLYAYTDALYAHKPGDTIDVVVLRGTERLTLKVTLGRRGA